MLFLNLVASHWPGVSKASGWGSESGDYLAIHMEEQSCLNWHAPLVADLSCDFKVFHFSVELAALGLLTKHNKARLKLLAFRCCDATSEMSISRNLLLAVQKHRYLPLSAYFMPGTNRRGFRLF